MKQFIIENQVVNVTAEIEDCLTARDYPKALSILKSSWPFFRNQINKERGLLIGEVLVQNGYSDFASGLLEHLALLHPRDPEVLRWWVHAYAELRDIGDIIPRGEIAVTNPNVHISTVEHLCDSLIKNGDYARAHELLKRNGKRLQSKGHRLMMHLYFYQTQNFIELIKYLNKIPETFSHRSEFATHKALSYLEIGQITKGYETLSELVSEGCINACYTKYELHRSENDSEAALTTLNEMLSFHGMASFAESWKKNEFKLDKLKTVPCSSSDDNANVLTIFGKR